MIDFDASEMDALGADLAKAAVEHPRQVRPIVQRGALNVKTDAQKLASGLSHAPHYPQSITYETSESPGKIEAVIGPDKNRRQGALGNILEFGTSKNAPIPHLLPAAKAEEPRYVKAIQDVAEDIL
jgi:hypothetical protein